MLTLSSAPERTDCRDRGAPLEPPVQAAPTITEEDCVDETRPPNGRQRVVIETVRPEIDSGRFPIKRVGGESVVVEADLFCDGHDMLSCRVLYRADTSKAWQECPMRPLGNDRWRAEFAVPSLGQYLYTVEGWVDHFATWRRDPTRPRSRASGRCYRGARSVARRW